MKYIINGMHLMINGDQIISAKFTPAQAVTDINDRRREFQPRDILPPYMTQAHLKVVTVEQVMEQDFSPVDGSNRGVASVSCIYKFTGLVAETFWHDLCRDGFEVTAPEEIVEDELRRLVFDRLIAFGIFDKYAPIFSRGHYEWLLQATKEEILAYLDELKEQENAKD